MKPIEQERLRQLEPWKKENINRLVGQGLMSVSDAHLVLDIAVHADAEAQKAIARVIATMPEEHRVYTTYLASLLTSNALNTLMEQIKRQAGIP